MFPYIKVYFLQCLLASVEEIEVFALYLRVDGYPPPVILVM